jgi:hypothetical protein
MIQDITGRWSVIANVATLHLSGSNGGVLSRIANLEDESWLFGINGKQREVPPEVATLFVSLEVSRLREIGEGSITNIKDARESEIRHAEKLFDRTDSKHDVLYHNGDFVVHIMRLPGKDRYQRFSVLLEIATNDSDGYYMVYSKEMKHWSRWPDALSFAINKAKEVTNGYVDGFGLESYLRRAERLDPGVGSYKCC